MVCIGTRCQLLHPNLQGLGHRHCVRILEWLLEKRVCSHRCKASTILCSSPAVSLKTAIRKASPTLFFPVSFIYKEVPPDSYSVFLILSVNIWPEKTADISQPRHWFPCEMRNERRNFILMTRHYPYLGG